MCEPSCPCMQFTPPDPATLCSCGMYPKGSRCPFCEMHDAGGVTSQPSRDETSAPSALADFDAAMRSRIGAETYDRLRAQQQEAPQAGTEPATPAVQHTEEESKCLANTAQPATTDTSPRSVAADLKPSSGFAGTTQEPFVSGGSAPKRKRGATKKPSRRTSQQVIRAAEQATREAEYREWWTSLGTATEGQLEDERAFLASLKDTE